MRTVLTLSAAICALAACAPRPHPYPAAEAPYLLHVPAPGTDYRYRGGPQGFGRTGPVYAPGPVYGPRPGYGGYGEGYQGPPPYGPPPGYGEYGHGYEAYGEGPRVGRRSDGYSWGDRRHSVRGGSSYESREMMTEESYFEGGVIVERETPRAPHRPAPYPQTSAPQPYPGPYREPSEPRPYPGPYAESSRFEPPRAEPPAFEAPRAGPPVPPPPQPRSPYPDAGPEPFY